MPFVILPTNSASGGYNITNSLRFNSGSQDYFNRTQGTSTNQYIATFSVWFKRSSLSTAQRIFEGYTATSDTGNGAIELDTLDRLHVDGYNTEWRVTSQLFRDLSAWYHLVVAYDTTQATASNRVKVYINGTEATAFALNANPAQNSTFGFNNNSSVLQIGRRRITASNDSFYNGYLSEMFWIDGQALTPSSFAESDFDTGIWKPKAYTGTYGTNGFYLQFKNSASLGTDSSGNGNTFTVNNLTSVDQSTDTPTNNFATLNPLMPSSTTLTEGNLALSGAKSANGTFGFTAGKWYWETKVTAVGGNAYIGIVDDTWYKTDNSWSLSQIWVYVSDATKYGNGASSSYGASYTTGDIIGTAVDMDNGTITFYKNGTSQGTAFTTGISGKLMFPWIYAGTSSYNINFGNPPYSGGSFTDSAGRGNFSYSVPSGYFALCTANLSTQG